MLMKLHPKKRLNTPPSDAEKFFSSLNQNIKTDMQVETIAYLANIFHQQLGLSSFP